MKQFEKENIKFHLKIISNNTTYFPWYITVASHSQICKVNITILCLLKHI